MRSGRLRLAALAGAAILVLLLASSAAMPSAGPGIAAVAVFPVENLTTGNVPGDQVRKFLIDRLASAGVKVLGDAPLDEFMTRHRVRYAAGIDAATGDALKKETGVDAVLIASIEMASQAAPPKIGLISRLVSLREVPAVVWADDYGVSGDDAPGLFQTGVVNDYQTMLKRALTSVGDSLLAYVKTGKGRTDPKTESKFRPKMSYRAVAIEPGKIYSVAVVPFFNLSDRRNAGEIFALLFMRHLTGLPQFRIVDIGVTRRQLLDARIIMDGGLSVTDADTVAALIEADFVLGGRVLRYEDYEGPAGRTRVDFSTVLIEKNSRKVVWSSSSYNEGSDGVRFFERGASKMAHQMATQMVRLTTEMIVGKK